jgi:hypothetical protein
MQSAPHMASVVSATSCPRRRMIQDVRRLRTSHPIITTMGLQLEFYAGDPDKIGPAFTDIELDGLRDGTLAHSYADLSLHISPTDLDILSEQIGVVLGQPPVLLLDSLERSIGGTPDESGASIVSPEWVAAVAAVPSASAAKLTSQWLASVAAESGGEVVTDSSDAVAAVSSLISLCREASARSTPVIFAWYL